MHSFFNTESRIYNTMPIDLVLINKYKLEVTGNSFHNYSKVARATSLFGFTFAQNFLIAGNK